MRGAIIAMVAAVAIAPTALLAVPVAHAAPVPCAPTDIACGTQYDEYFDANCRSLMGQGQAGWSTEYFKCIDAFPGNPGWCDICKSRPPVTTEAQAPATRPVQAPVTKPAVVARPKGLTAPASAVEAARAAPATHVDPANPPPPPTQADFNQRVQSVITTHSANIDVVNGLAHPRHWDYMYYDTDHHPVFYNPMSEAMTFRYFYGGDYREVYVAAGSNVVLDVGVDGVFPFTAVGDDYLTSGSFLGGAPPALYQDVAAYVPAYNQTVQVGQVQPVGHDDSQPAGSQDSFMLDDSTLAWGQATNPSNGGQITVTKTQTLPGVGPTDDGKSLIDLAAAPHDNKTGAVVKKVVLYAVVMALGLGALVWNRRRKRTA